MIKTPVECKAISQLLILQTLAGFSQWLDVFLIFSVPAFAWNATPEQMAFIASCFGLPGLFFAPLVGALLDRFDPRHAALLGSMLRTALTGVIAFAPGLPTFAALVFCKGLANVLYWPAMSILTQRMVAPAQRVKYFSSLSSLDQLSKIITPLMTGIATLVMGAQWLFLLSAALSLTCAQMIYLLPKVQIRPQELRSTLLPSGRLRLLSGWRSISSLPWVLILSIVLGIGMCFALAIYDPHLPAYLHSLNFDSAIFALLVSATGLGAMCGALWVRFLQCKTSPAALMRAGIALFFTATTSAAVLAQFHAETTSAALLTCIWFVSGLGYEIFLIGNSVTMQNLCPAHVLGRVTTSARSLQMLAMVTGPLIGAWLIGTQSRALPFGAAALVVGVMLVASMQGLAKPSVAPP